MLFAGRVNGMSSRWFDRLFSFVWYLSLQMQMIGVRGFFSMAMISVVPPLSSPPTSSMIMTTSFFSSAGFGFGADGGCRPNMVRRLREPRWLVTWSCRDFFERWSEALSSTTS